MLASQRALGTMQEKCCYIARTEFARNEIHRGGCRGTIVVKPCFVNPDPGARTRGRIRFCFWDGWSAGKGLRPDSVIWEDGRALRIGGNVPLRIAGDGRAAQGA